MNAIAPAFVIAALLPFHALALQPSACAFVRLDPDPADGPPPPPPPGEAFLWLRDEAKAPVDLGAGWVLHQYEFSSNSGSQFGAKVVDCASGTGVIVVEGAQIPQGQINIIARLTAEDAFRAAIASDQVVSLDGVLAQLSAAGAEVGPDTMHLADFESCGCAAFYPELRGTKTAWSSQ